MPHFIKKNIKLFLAITCLTSYSLDLYAITFPSNSLFGHDAYPIYSTLDPHEFLYRRERERLKGFWDEEVTFKQERFGLSISLFGQYADRGRNIRNEKIHLGDLGGKWNMLALLFGRAPQGQCLPPILQEAKCKIFSETTCPLMNMHDENYIDPKEQFGFFTTPLKYRKCGARFELDFLMGGDFGMSIQFGVVNICQCLENICIKTRVCCEPCDDVCCTITDSLAQKDITEDPCCPEVTTCPNDPCCPEGCPENPCCLVATSRSSAVAPQDLTCFACNNPRTGKYGPAKRADVQRYLMNRVHEVTRALCYDMCCFNKCGIEDLRFNLFWRHAIEINRDEVEEEWPFFLLIPYVAANFTAALGKIKPYDCVYSLPFGNNGHHAAGLSAGLDLDFAETVEIGGEGGFVYYFSNEFCNYPVPNYEFQSGIYPFRTNVRVSPGLTCYGGLKLSAYHFLGKLSGYFQYVIVCHKKDKICLCKDDPAFKPCLLECISDWKTQLMNIGFNYDVSRNISLGFLWQAPLSQKRAYRSSTVMFGFNAVY